MLRYNDNICYYYYFLVRITKKYGWFKFGSQIFSGFSNTKMIIVTCVQCYYH